MCVYTHTHTLISYSEKDREKEDRHEDLYKDYHYARDDIAVTLIQVLVLILVLASVLV